MQNLQHLTLLKGSPLSFRQLSHQHLLHSAAQTANVALPVLLYGLLPGCGCAAEDRRVHLMKDDAVARKLREDSSEVASLAAAGDPTPVACKNSSYMVRMHL